MYNLRLEDATPYDANPRAGEVTISGDIVEAYVAKFGYSVGQQFLLQHGDDLVWTIVGFSGNRIIVTNNKYSGLYHTELGTVNKAEFIEYVSPHT